MRLLSRQFLTKKKIKGAGLVLLAWVFFTLVIALSRPASKSTSVPAVLLFQNIVSLIILTPWMLYKGKKSFRLRKVNILLIRSLAGYLSFAFTFLAVQRTSLVNAMLLSNSAPLFIPLVIWLWKRVTIPRRLWIGIAIGFIGIAIILQPDCNFINRGALFAIAAAICLSISMISQRRLMKTEKVYSVLFYYLFISALLSTPFAIAYWKPIDMSTLLLFLVIGLCFILGQICFLNALGFEKPSFLGSFNYSAVVYGALFEWLIWHNYPGWICIVGIAIVCTGGIIVILQGGDSTKKGDRSSG
ncbi:MAG: Riboflavin transporter [Chlamydiae bacterium]|nr:Riboflavin transporter [Chlamydiota bacterium]